ncbi:Signal recognition particle, SRP54 subunit, GTPase domain protein [Candidatus Thiomargarita nelsonii]|uniref:Signal recognition particle, SRP54 subunit, GTPase domain protein n=1 Tax=Candidatus Thiomargarita nelsonii TaxID=1003181 RepID=A0A0A6NY47_9GAMM|nr:Signal recognition particle, SRP54 subunit, GTPase domain protein [Candidatus Thiomargarita nelsonii]
MPKQTTMMMLGPDAVGKTTLLATMYHEFDNQSDFELTTSGDTHQNLQEAYQKLSSIITQPSFTQTGQLLKGTAGIVEHRFEIQFSGKKELELVFCDIAGGVIRAENNNNRDFEEFKQKLEEATVIMIVVEAPALIEGNVQSNNPLPVYERLLPTVIDKRNHLILFVITKCEAWLKKVWGR